MLYSFIPPVIVVLSLIGIIIFLARKASQVALLDDGKKDESGIEMAGEKKGFWGKIRRSGNSNGQSMKHGFLVFLEKFTRKLRVFFLKLENLFTYWSENIRRKRRNQAELENNQSEDGNVEVMGSAEFSDGMGQEAVSGETSQDSKNKIYIRDAGETRRILTTGDYDEKTVRPIISEKVVIPRTKPEIKNRLERILIERIASNPKDTEAYERLGEYYFEIENYEHSKECFKQVMKLDPMNAGARDKMRRLERLLFRR
jgi:hypothetical protein